MKAETCRRFYVLSVLRYKVHFLDDTLIVGNYCRARQTTGNNMAHLHCTLDT